MVNKMGIKHLEVAHNLTFGEVSCPCIICCGLTGLLHVRLLNAWDQLRRRLGIPIQIISGYRCGLQNKAVNGSIKSQHMFGKALDISLKGFDYMGDELLREFIMAGFTGIGRSKKQLHVDVRPEPYFFIYESPGVIEVDHHAEDLYSSMMGKTVREEGP